MSLVVEVNLKNTCLWSAETQGILVNTDQSSFVILPITIDADSDLTVGAVWSCKTKLYLNAHSVAT